MQGSNMYNIKTCTFSTYHFVLMQPKESDFFHFINDY